MAAELQRRFAPTAESCALAEAIVRATVRSARTGVVRHVLLAEAESLRATGAALATASEGEAANGV